MSAHHVGVGASLGGLAAVSRLLKGLPGDLGCPITIVQHRDARSGADLREILQAACALPVSEAEDKQPIAPGHVYLAPPDYHLLIDGGCFALSLDAPVQHARPSIDVFFESLAAAYGASAVGVLLTGSNRDGARGLALIKARGGTVIVQDPSTAEDPTMPSAGMQETAVDAAETVELIAERVVSTCHTVRA